MAGVKLASFPNSRIKPRGATRERITSEIVATQVAPVQLLPINTNRTNAILFNQGDFDVRYQYVTAVGILVDGFLLKTGTSVTIDTVEAIHAQSTGAAPAETATLSIDEGQG